MIRFPQLVLCLLITVISFLQAKPVQATTVGFSYLVNINFRHIEGTLPKELNPLHSIFTVFGSYYFDSDAPNTGQEPSEGFYDTTLPFVSGAHFLRWVVGSSVIPPEISFQDTGIGIFNDWLIPSNPPLPQPEYLDSYSVGSQTIMHITGQSDLSTILGSVFFQLTNIEIANPPIGPLTSNALPLTPPSLDDFKEGNNWEFKLQKFGQDGWSIDLIGEVLRLEPAAAPEPSSQWLSLIGLLFLLLFQQRKRYSNQ